MLIYYNSSIDIAFTTYYLQDKKLSYLRRTARRTMSVEILSTAAGGWRRGVMVTALVVSTKLLYVKPG